MIDVSESDKQRRTRFPRLHHIHGGHNYFPERIRRRVCIDFSEETFSSAILAWDNGDYIMEISAVLNKNGTIYLSKINKL